MTERARKTAKQTTVKTARRRPAKATPAVVGAALAPTPPEDDRILQLTEANRQLKRKIFDLYTIFEISRNFNAVLKFQNLLDTFIFTCLGQVGALKGAIFLKNEPVGGKLFLVKTRGSGTFPTDELGFEPDSRLLSYLSGLNRPVKVSELVSDTCTAEELAVLEHFQTGVAVPLVYQTRLIGLFLLSDKISGRQFQLDDMEFLSILANQIAVAIENARLYEGERAAAAQLRDLQQQLLQTEKLAALGEMSAKIAHEVNNPLGIIKNYLLLVRRSAGDMPEAQQHVTVIEQEINRIAGIVRQLLDFHRPKPIVFDRVDTIKIIEEVIALLERPLTSSNIEVIRQYSAENSEILGSGDSLKQVIINLVINARDAMPDGGHLTIRLDRDPDGLHMSFSDTGPGIPPEIVPRIFDPFFTTKEHGQGTGLGLSVCYGIIKSHGGTISFRNTEQGGCFDILLPTTLKEPEVERRD